jgi:hypothetical protein
MNLAVILGIYFFSMAWLPPGIGGFLGQEPAGQVQSSEQAPPAQSSEPAQAPPAPTGKDAGASDPAKLSPQPHRRHRKQNPNCTNSATAVNPIAGGSGGSENPKATADSSNTSEKTTSASLPPCPPPKKVIHNGGSEEPTIQLIGGTPAEQASNQRSTEQLTAATEENLKKIAERKLTPSQQEMVNQVKQFMEQSKTAVAAGNLERGHNLARKAQLLSEELLKP